MHKFLLLFGCSRWKHLYASCYMATSLRKVMRLKYGYIHGDHAGHKERVANICRKMWITCCLHPKMSRSTLNNLSVSFRVYMPVNACLFNWASRKLRQQKLLSKCVMLDSRVKNELIRGNLRFKAKLGYTASVRPSGLFSETLSQKILRNSELLASDSIPRSEVFFFLLRDNTWLW